MPWSYEEFMGIGGGTNEVPVAEVPQSTWTYDEFFDGPSLTNQQLQDAGRVPETFNQQDDKQLRQDYVNAAGGPQSGLRRAGEGGLYSFGLPYLKGVQELSDQTLGRVGLDPFEAIGLGDEGIDNFVRDQAKVQDDYSSNHGWFENALTGVAQSMIPMVGHAVVGSRLKIPATVAMAGGFGATRAIEASVEAKDAGLKGADAAKYTAIQTGFEVVPMLVFAGAGKVLGNRIPWLSALGGAEGEVAGAVKAAQGAIKEGFKEAGKKVGKKKVAAALTALAAEEAEELITSFGQAANAAAMQDPDRNFKDPGNKWEIFRDTTAAVILNTTAAHAGRRAVEATVDATVGIDPSVGKKEYPLDPHGPITSDDFNDPDIAQDWVTENPEQAKIAAKNPSRRNMRKAGITMTDKSAAGREATARKIRKAIIGSLTVADDVEDQRKTIRTRGLYRGEEKVGETSVMDTEDQYAKALYDFPNRVKAHSRVYRIGNVTIDDENLQGLGIGQLLYLDMLRTDPKGLFWNSGMSGSALRALQELKRKGHVHAEFDEDNKSHLLQITPKGLKRVNQEMPEDDFQLTGDPAPEAKKKTSIEGDPTTQQTMFVGGRDAVGHVGGKEVRQDYLFTEEEEAAAKTKKSGPPETGVPITARVSHGTTAEFDSFDSGKRGSATHDDDTSFGVFFTDSKDEAQKYTKGVGRVIEADVRFENPLVLDATSGSGRPKPEVIRKAQADGHDGIIITGMKTGKDANGNWITHTEYIAFDESQITIVKTKKSGPPVSKGDPFVETVKREGIDGLLNGRLQQEANWYGMKRREEVSAAFDEVFRASSPDQLRALIAANPKKLGFYDNESMFAFSSMKAVAEAILKTKVVDYTKPKVRKKREPLEKIRDINEEIGAEYGVDPEELNFAVKREVGERNQLDAYEEDALKELRRRWNVNAATFGGNGEKDANSIKAADHSFDEWQDLYPNVAATLDEAVEKIARGKKKPASRRDRDLVREVAARLAEQQAHYEGEVEWTDEDEDAWNNGSDEDIFSRDLEGEDVSLDSRGPAPGQGEFDYEGQGKQPFNPKGPLGSPATEPGDKQGKFDYGDNPPFDGQKKIPGGRQKRIGLRRYIDRWIPLSARFNGGKIRPIDMPELVEIVNELIKDPIKLRLAVKKLRGGTKGVFKAKVGTNRYSHILIDALEAGDSRLAAKVLAHEIGHLVDFVGEGANAWTVARGNILGRIAKLPKIFKDSFGNPYFAKGDDAYLGASPFGEQPWTPQEVDGWRKSIIEWLSEEEYGEIDEEIEEIVQVEGATAQDIKDIFQTGSSRPEVESWFSKLSDRQKAIVVRDAIKGIVPNDQLFQGLQQVVKRKTGKKIKVPVASKLPSKAAVKRALKKQMKAEADRRNLIEARVVHEELRKLSEWWNPYNKELAKKQDPKYIKYRNSSVELFAEAVSVLLNAPKELQTRAPTFWKAIMAYQTEHSQFFDIWWDIQKSMSKRKDLFDRRRASAEQMFGRGRGAFLHELEAREASKVSMIASITNSFRQIVFDRFDPGQKIADGTNNLTLKHMLDELHHIDNGNHTYLTNLTKDVGEPLKELGITTDEIGLYAFYRRIAARGRSMRMGETKGGVIGYHELANPLGHQVETAAEGLAALRRDLGPKKFKALHDTMQKWYQQNFAVSAYAHRSGLITDSAFTEIIAPNANNYASFNVIDYLEANIDSRILKQVGTYQDVEDPFAATVSKFLALRRAAELNAAKAELTNTLMGYYPGEITRYAHVASKTSQGWIKYERPRDAKLKDGQDWLLVYEGGRPVSYAVDESYKKMFDSHDIGFLKKYVAPLVALSHKVFHPLYITFSLGFQVANVPRDFMRTWRNLGSLAGRYGETVSLADVLKAYWATKGSAWRRARGIDDAYINHMTQARALDIPFVQADAVVKDLVGGTDSFGGRTEYELKKYGLVDTAPRRKKYGRLIGGLLDALEVSTTFGETMSKTAGYKILSDKIGMSPKEAAYNVRKYVGTPDYKTRGLGTSLFNSLWMYSNVRWQGMRGDWDLALDNKTRGAWWTGFFLTTVLPKVAMLAALKGLFGDEEEEKMKRIHSSMLKNYIVPPWMSTTVDEDTGNPLTWFLTIPQSDTDRFLGNLLSSLFLQDREAGSVFPQMFQSVTSEGIPNWHPAIGQITAWSQFASGINPYDGFRGRNIIPREHWEAGGWYATSKMLSWTVDQSGAAKIILGPIRDATLGAPFQGKELSTTEVMWRNVPGFHRVMRVSDSGLREAQYAEAGRAERAAARQRLESRSPVVKSLTSEASLNQRSTPSDPARAKRVKDWYSSYLSKMKRVRKFEKAGNTQAADRLRQKIEQEAEAVR